MGMHPEYANFPIPYQNPTLRVAERVKFWKAIMEGVGFEHKIVPHGSDSRRWKGPSSHQFCPNMLIRARLLKLKKLTTQGARRANIPQKALSKPLGPKDKIPRKEIETYK